MEPIVSIIREMLLVLPNKKPSDQLSYKGFYNSAYTTKKCPD